MQSMMYFSVEMDGSDSGSSKKNEDSAPLLSDSSNGKDKDSSIVKEVKMLQTIIHTHQYSLITHT